MLFRKLKENDLKQFPVAAHK